MTTETDHLVALGRLQARYADAISSRNWAALDDLFLADAPIHLDLVTSPPRSIVGPTALAAFVEGAIERYDHFTFVILNSVVDLVADGDPAKATGRLFMCEVRHETATDAWTEAHGLYRDRYRFHDGRWRFAERHYRSLARRGPGGVVLGLPDDEDGAMIDRDRLR